MDTPTANPMDDGDLYPHNTLVNPAGAAYLSDFGAASFYHPDDHAGAALKRLEVRAFGCLLEDLCDRIATPWQNSGGERACSHRSRNWGMSQLYWCE